MWLNERVYQLESPKGAHCYLLLAQQPVLVDTGLPVGFRAICRELEELGYGPGRLRHILLTHHDIDHMGNAGRLGEWLGAAVWVHPLDLPFTTGAQHRPGFKKYLGLAMKHTRLENPSPLDENWPVSEIRLFHTPGHTPGHVCALFDGMLFAGDLVEHKKGVWRPYPAFWNWNTRLLQQTISGLHGLSFQWICPSHGTPALQSRLPGWK